MSPADTERDDDEREEGAREVDSVGPARAEPGGASKRRGAERTVALVLVVAWLIVTAIAGAALWRGGFVVAGGLESLLPEVDRRARGEPWVLIEIEPERDKEAELDDPREALRQAGAALEEQLGEERQMLAPPAGEIERWLDGHALYLLDVDQHGELAARLSDPALRSAAQSMRARMSSPLFAAFSDQSRRDPLDLQAVMKREAGELGHVEIEAGQAGAGAMRRAQVTPSGDLLAADGRSALVQLRSERGHAQVVADVEAALAGHPVKAAVLGPEADDAAAFVPLAEDGSRALWICFAGAMLLMAVAVRRVAPVLTVLGLLASGAAVIAWTLGGFDLLGFALFVLLIGFGADSAIKLQRIATRGWASSLVFATALLPLMLSQWPAWRAWGLTWAGAALGLAVLMRVVLPAALRMVGGRGERGGAGGPSGAIAQGLELPYPGFRLQASPLLGVALCLAGLSAGAWAMDTAEVRPGVTLPLADSAHAEARAVLRANFFDPDLIVEAETWADPEAAQGSRASALDRAAGEVGEFSGLVPTVAVRVDSPGSFVIPRAQLEARRTSLTELRLGERMQALDTALEDHELQAEAFSEFMRGASSLAELPSAEVALDGPLGPWIERYFVEDTQGRAAIRTRVELRGEDGIAGGLAELPDPVRERLRGPAMAASADYDSFDDRLGLVVVAGLWLVAFLVWLGTGRLGIALGVSVVALASESGTLAILVALELPLGPHLAPVLLLVGAAAAVAGARACQSVELERPIVARGVLLSAGCQIVAALALVVSNQPVWRELGMAAAIGCALACGLGLFAAPGIAGISARLTRRRTATPQAGGQRLARRRRARWIVSDAAGSRARSACSRWAG